MATIFRSPIEELVDRLFDEYDPRGGDEIPVLGGLVGEAARSDR